MKIILSRKGVDSGRTSGMMASPILPCGCLCSIPIPHTSSTADYSDICFRRRSLLEVCRDLDKDWEHKKAHLDPDLRLDALRNRPKSWRPLFGQSGAAAGHLIKQDIKKDSLFLFFGWFRKTEINEEGQIRFSASDPQGKHVLFGWLQVEEVIDSIPLRSELRFANYHPHIQFFHEEKPNNRIFVAAKDDLGAGVFSKVKEDLILTDESQEKRSKWLLNEAFRSLQASRDLTYHGKEVRWPVSKLGVSLQSVSRGQEFVFDGSRHPAVERHVRKLIQREKLTGGPCENCWRQP